MLAPVTLEIACRIASTLPPETRAVLARGLARLQYPLDGRRRRSALANLEAIAASGMRPDLADPAAREGAARSMFAAYLAFLLEYLAQGRLRGRSLETRARWSGMETLYAALSAGRGGVICLPHLGNWEIAGLALARAGFRVHVVTGVQWSRALTGAAREMKERERLRVSSPADGFVPLLATLRSGGLVALMADGDVYSRSLPARFFGRTIPFPAGPAILARRAGAPLLHAHAERLGGDRWRFAVDGADPPDRSLPVDADLRRLTQRAASALERSIAAHVEQWCVFRPMFPVAGTAGSPGAAERAHAA